jgi:hypothetical protein
MVPWNDQGVPLRQLPLGAGSEGHCVVLRHDPLRRGASDDPAERALTVDNPAVPAHTKIVLSINRHRQAIRWTGGTAIVPMPALSAFALGARPGAGHHHDLHTTVTR